MNPSQNLPVKRILLGMNILLIGGGEIGSLIADSLHHSHSVTVMDISAERKAAFTNVDVRFLQGSGTDPEDLRLANISETDALIACTENDDINVLSCLAGKGLGAKRTLAFVSRRRYIEAFANMGPMESVGLIIDRTLWPQSILARQIVDVISVPRALDTAFFARGKVKLVEYKLEEGDPLLEGTLAEASLPQSILVVGSIREDSFIIPTGQTSFELGDKVVFMGTVPSIKQLEQLFAPKQRSSRIAIIGGGNVGFMVAEKIAKIRNNFVTMIELNEERCQKLAKNVPQALILQGDGTDLELLEQERIEEADVLVAVTDDDSKNLLISLLGKQLGIPKVITRVGRAKNRRLFERVGVDALFTPRSAAVQEVLNWLQVNEVDHLASIEDRAEVMEVVYPRICQVGKIRDIGAPPHSLIGAIQRGTQVIIPRGDTTIQHSDHLYIVTTPDNASAVHQWLEKQGK